MSTVPAKKGPHSYIVQRGSIHSSVASTASFVQGVCILFFLILLRCSSSDLRRKRKAP